MAYLETYRAQPWLESPLLTPAGGVQLAGALQDNPGIDPTTMRVLGSYALIYMVSAQGYYADVRGVRRDLVTGDVALIFPELAHAYGPNPGTSWRHLYFVFSGPQFDLWRKSGLLDPVRPVWRAEPVDFWARQLEESHRLLAGLDAKGWLTPQQVARMVGLSYENFRKQFTARTGVSPGQFQKRKRIERAQSAIYHGDHTLKQLAEELEFCDVFHFSKVFKQITGSTPSEFRRKVRG